MLVKSGFAGLLILKDSINKVELLEEIQDLAVPTLAGLMIFLF